MTAERKPSIVLFGLTLLMKGLLPKFFPTKKAIESTNALIRTTYKINNLSLLKFKDKEDNESVDMIWNTEAKNPK